MVTFAAWLRSAALDNSGAARYLLGAAILCGLALVSTTYQRLTIGQAAGRPQPR
ncbi:MAG: hypothetical protein ACR2K2_12830 [Mycobacteriales bacterium]